MKNRKRESCTSGTVRDEDGDILIYSAAVLRENLDLTKSGDLFALLPQALRGRIVPSGGARLDLAAIIEIAAADIGELRRTREMDDGVRAGLGRAGEHHRSPHDPPEQACVTLPEVRRDESGVQAIRSDAGARESARKLAGEQDVAELGAAIGNASPVSPGALQIVEVERGAQIRGGSGVDHPRRRRGMEAFRSPWVSTK
jgi:hypothetical protein